MPCNDTALTPAAVRRTSPRSSCKVQAGVAGEGPRLALDTEPSQKCEVTRMNCPPIAKLSVQTFSCLLLEMSNLRQDTYSSSSSQRKRLLHHVQASGGGD